jgi:transcriptional regulator with AAA-type ATPase domain
MISNPADTSANDGCRRDIDNVAEQLQLLEALQHAGWNRRHAAKLLNISYGSLLTKLRKHGFNPETGQQS